MAVIHGTNIEVNKVPSLDLRFADRKSLVDTISGRNLIDFSRSSTGTYVGSDGLIKTAAVDEARFDHDSAGNSLGLLIEESRTNLQTYSEDFSQWTITVSNDTPGASVSTNFATAPDGTTTADKFIPVNESFNYIRRNTITASNWSLTVYMKAAGMDYAAIAVGTSGSVWFNLANGTIQTETNATGQIQALANGWYRCTLVKTGLASTVQFRIFPGDDASSSTITTADGVKGILIWGAQAEDATFPTSYIPTTSSTATRSADVASMTGTNFSSWYNQTEGTVFADITDLGYPLNTFGSLWKIFASTSHTSGRNSINMSRYSGGALPEARFGITDQNAVSQVSLVTTSPPTSARVKSAIGLQSGSYAASSHGNTVVTSSAAVPPTFVAADTLAFGQATNSTLQAKSCLIARLTYYPQRLQDSTLQKLTE